MDACIPLEGNIPSLLRVCSDSSVFLDMPQGAQIMLLISGCFLAHLFVIRIGEERGEQTTLHAFAISPTDKTMLLSGCQSLAHAVVKLYDHRKISEICFHRVCSSGLFGMTHEITLSLE